MCISKWMKCKATCPLKALNYCTECSRILPKNYCVKKHKCVCAYESNYSIMRIWFVIILTILFSFHWNGRVGERLRIQRQHCPEALASALFYAFKFLAPSLSLSLQPNSNEYFNSNSGGNNNNENQYKPCFDVWKHVILWTNACLTYKENESCYIHIYRGNVSSASLRAWERLFTEEEILQFIHKIEI